MQTQRGNHPRKHFRQYLVYATIVLLMGALSMSGCSSSEMSESEAPDAIFPPADAATDPVPMDSAEAIPPAVDPNTLPPADLPPSADGVPPPVETAQAPLDPPAPVDSTPPPVEATPAMDTAAAPPALGSSSEYRAQSGDTLMKIAFETYGDLTRWKEIYDANRDVITDPNRIPKGLVLKLQMPSTPVVIEKNGERYQIKRGDTLGTISRDLYGTQGRWRDLWANNKQLIKDPNKIYAGFDLYYLPAEPRMPASQ